MIDVIGTEGYLTKIDGTHTIGFSASYGFPRDWVYITSAWLNAKFKCRCSFDYPKRLSQSRTCSDLHMGSDPTSHVDISAPT